MKITKTYLKKIIKEEFERVMENTPANRYHDTSGKERKIQAFQRERAENYKQRKALAIARAERLEDNDMMSSIPKGEQNWLDQNAAAAQALERRSEELWGLISKAVKH